MKIAYIVLKGMPLGGGIEKYTEEIGSRLVGRGHKIIVYTMKHYGARDGDYRGMKIKTVPTLRNKSLEKITASFMATLSLCAGEQSDIVHFHAFGPAMFGALPRLLGRRVVTQGHGLEWRRSKWGVGGKVFLKLAETPSIKFAHAVAVVSKVQQKYLAEKYGIKSIYIPTGVNPPQVESAELIKKYGLTGNDYILFAARLVKEKGAHYLIDAYKRVNPKQKLVIAGDAQHEERYKSELRKMAGDDNKNIIFTGFVTGKLLHELFSNCYIFVLPSEIEGLPIALLEAMSYGNCCLVSDIPENIEAMSGYGYTFHNQDVENLASQLEYLINNYEAVNSLKERAKKHVLHNYSWDTIASDFEDLYLNLIKNSPNKIN